MGVTRVDFYTGATDSLLVACRLCAKVIQQELQAVIYLPDAEWMDQFDKLLWTFSATSFVPHCRADDKLAAITPIILSDRLEMLAANETEVLFNLSTEIPVGVERFMRVVEIVDETENNKQFARERYRHYQASGSEIRHHQIG